MKFDVFISYSRKDTEIANRISKAFKENDITFFIDRQGIGGGLEFPAVLAKAIRESKVFLFLASKNSYDSKFTQSEIIYAFNKKNKSDIIPYIIDGSSLPDELEFTFSAINWRNMSEHPIETILIEDVLSRLGKSRPKKYKSQVDHITIQENVQESKYSKKYWRYYITGILSLLLLIALMTYFINKGEIGRTTDIVQSINPTENTDKEYFVNNRLFNNTDLGSYIYTGEINSSDIPDGKGKAVFVNGDIFEGDFSNGNYTEGRYTWSEDGTYFEGEFTNNEPNEKKGFYYDKDGNKQQN